MRRRFFAVFCVLSKCCLARLVHSRRLLDSRILYFELPHLQFIRKYCDFNMTFVRVLFPILVICACSHPVSLAAKTHNVFYIMGSDGIYVINPEEKRIEAKITNTSSPGLCTESKNRVSRSPCYFSKAVLVDDSVYVADAPGSAVKVIDLKTQKKTETIRTDPFPYGLYNLPWRNEVWVHSWKNATFDVINTEKRTRTHRAIRAHIKPGWTHGVMLAQKNLLDGDTGYVTHLWNTGVHQIDLKSKAYVDFFNLSSEGCIGTYGIVYTPVTKNLFVKCRKRRGSSIIVLGINNKLDKGLSILRNLSYNRDTNPFVSPDGRYIVILSAPANQTAKKLLDSRMNVLEITTSTSIGFTEYPELRIPGGLSEVAFYPKKAGSYYAFVTLKYANKIAVVDLGLGKNGRQSDVTYIEDVGELNTTGHATSRGIYSGGKWIVSPASKSKTVVVIDAEARKVHGTVRDVNGGGFGIWVPDDEVVNGASGSEIAHMIIMVSAGWIFIKLFCIR